MIKPEIKIKRVYEKPSDDDGIRILVDRLWPRGLSKQAARVDEWFKEVAPSNELRAWYGHDPEKFAEFQKKYREELTSNKAFSDLLDFLEGHDKVTLLFATKDVELSNALVLYKVLQEHFQ